MLAVAHDLNAIRPSTDVAVREVAETPADALRWNRAVLRACGLLGARRKRSETQQAFRAIAPGHGGHVCFPKPDHQLTRLDGRKPAGKPVRRVVETGLLDRDAGSRRAGQASTGSRNGKRHASR